MNALVLVLLLGGAPAAPVSPAAKFNTDGFRAYQAKKYADALALFKQGFTADEKHALSHYNYAATLGLLRKQGKVCEFDAYQSAVLEHLEVAVKLDEGRRKRMQKDGDFDSIRDTVRYLRLLGKDPAKVSDARAFVTGVTWFAPSVGVYGNMAELKLTGNTFTLSRKVMNDATGEVSVVKHTGSFTVLPSDGTVTLIFNKAFEGKSQLEGKLTAEGHLVFAVLGELTDERSECDA